MCFREVRVGPYRKYVSRRMAKRINNMLRSSQVPDRTALKKESEEFIEYLKQRRTEEKE